jgi:hypothetical protein
VKLNYWLDQQLSISNIQPIRRKSALFNRYFEGVAKIHYTGASAAPEGMFCPTGFDR